MSKTGITLNLQNVSGNAFAILGVARRAMERAGKRELWDAFHKEATSGDYNNLLCTVSDWFDVTFGEDEDEEYNEED